MTDATPLVVVGAGGFGRETLDVIEAIARHEPDRFRLLGVLDDSPSALNLERLAARGIPHLGAVGDWIAAASTPASYVVAIGNPTVRADIASTLDAAGFEPAVVIHPRSGLGSAVSVGAGTVVCAGVEVSTNVTLGRHVHVNPNATVGHDSAIGDFVSVNPGAVISGDVQIGRGALVGAGAVVLQGLEIGEGATIGAGACVVRSVEPGVVVKGVPAR